jgi:hypothetical protein
VLRRLLCTIRNPGARRFVARLLTVGIYLPLIGIGHVFQLFGKGRAVPLYEWYHGMSVRRIEQDAYDRFFTSIEQRVSRQQIRSELAPWFETVTISEAPPYWHFVCDREAIA